MTEPDLPDDAVVVRGGELRDLDGLRQKVLKSALTGGRRRLSVFSREVVEPMTTEDVVASICEDVPVRNGKVQLCRLGDLRERGFEVVREGDEHEDSSHHHVYFADEVADNQLASWLDCFSEPVPKPRRRDT